MARILCTCVMFFLILCICFDLHHDGSKQMSSARDFDLFFSLHSILIDLITCKIILLISLRVLQFAYSVVGFHGSGIVTYGEALAAVFMEGCV